MSGEKILVVDDDRSIRALLSDLLGTAGYDVLEAGDGNEALEMLDSIPFDAVITDLRMPGIGGLELIKGVLEKHKDVICMVMTGHATVDTAVQAMKAGAYDYISKPVNRDKLLLTLKKGLEFRKLQSENVSLRKNLRKKYSFTTLVGDCEAMQKVYSIVETVADTDSTVLILGESGTGKELVAKTIHYNSSRSEKPFIPINCGAIPEPLMESELFGYEKGAFTGAHSSRAGRFELASGGTIFLDEIGDMSPALQVKLLRVLQEKEVERLGGAKTVKVDVRVVAATNQDLEKAVSEKRFREDLYYRINVIPVTIPPLRERPGDIPLLINHFLNAFSKKRGKGVDGISEEAVSALISYRWPGNVRELENLIERVAVLKKEGVITLSDLPEKFAPAEGKAVLSPVVIPEEGISLESAVDEFENNLIRQALKKADGVKSKAAHLLQMNRTTLIEKMKKKGLN